MTGPGDLSTEAVGELLNAHAPDTDFSALSDSDRARIAWMLPGVEEVVGLDHLVSAMASGESHAGDGVLRCYVGYEPSGKAHIGWLVQSLTLRRILDSGCNVLIFLADWHAWVNDKFGGDMDKIRTTARYMEEIFRVLLGNPAEGEGSGELRFLYASELMESGDYWATVLRCSKNMSLSRVRRTFSIMGRGEDAGDNDTSKFFYPAMQAADIFEMHIDIALGGMDQRKAHMYMRDVADRYGWTKATCVHTPIISSLKASGARMESFDHKMSKSDPEGAVLLHDEPDELGRKLRKAYLDPEDSDSPVHELVEQIIMPQLGSLTITPDPKYGEPSTWDDLAALRKALAAGEVHPLDYKLAVADALAGLLAPLAEHFAAAPDLLAAVSEITGD
ncbi:MAG: tyrosine--tRNA ligase [Methanobacteriota archaeon]|nr:MAG: tyrosine--tRNA ligase [Euryarchaeota archaeon]